MQNTYSYLVLCYPSHRLFYGMRNFMQLFKLFLLPLALRSFFGANFTFTSVLQIALDYSQTTKTLVDRPLLDGVVLPLP